MSSVAGLIPLGKTNIQPASQVFARAFQDDWYLQLLGVDPEHQGRGYATALLTPMLTRLDHERLPCCLDTMNGDNVAFYERFGFRVVAKSLLPKTVIGLWLMARGG